MTNSRRFKGSHLLLNLRNHIEGADERLQRNTEQVSLPLKIRQPTRISFLGGGNGTTEFGDVLELTDRSRGKERIGLEYDHEMDFPDGAPFDYVEGSSTKPGFGFVV